MSRKLIVLHSGGLDSTVCLLLAIEKGYNPISVGIDYNQYHSIELKYAEDQCKKYNIARKVIKVTWHKPERNMPLDRNLDQIKSGVSSAFLPGRNAVFLVLACAEAPALGAQKVWLGINSIDFSGYPDCRPEFLNAFKNMVKEAFVDPPEIEAPLINLTKQQIAQEGLRLGLTKGDTWSCYRPKKTKNGYENCTRCDACKLHEFAWSFLNNK